MDDVLEMFFEELPSLVSKGDVGIEIIKSQVKIIVEASVAKQSAIDNK